MLVKQYGVKRIPAVNDEEEWMKGKIDVALELPLTIDIEEIGYYTILCSPSDRHAMAVGFMFTEGIIKEIGDIDVLADCADSSEIVRVRLKEPPKKNTDMLRRNMLVVSSYGMRGSTGIREKIAALPRVDSTLCIDSKTMNSLMGLLHDKQHVFKKTGGTHGILIFNEKGDIVSFAEDVSRHNALDKAIGQILLAGRTTKGNGVVLSGRVSFEMISKCSLAGIEIILAVSAPTSLALDTALHCGMTLCAYVRNSGATVFTHPERIKQFQATNLE